jgi:type IV fimbrial biogenesis protein FimT
MKPAALRLPAARGFTLIELMVVVALGAILLSLAAPSFMNFLAKKRVEGVMAELVTDLQYARSEAVQRNAIVRVISGTSCYAVHVAGSTAATSCTSLGTGAVNLKTVQLTSASTVGPAFTSNNSKAFIEFDPVRGMAIDAAAADASGYFDVTSPSSLGDWQLRAIVTKVGRVRTCSPNGSVAGVSSDCS